MNEFGNITQPQEDELFNSFDPEKFLFILRKSLIWILFFFVLTVSFSYLYVRYTKPLYESVSILKLDFESEARTLGLANMEAVGYSELSGEIELLKSRLFFSRVADVVDMDVSYHYYGRYLTDERYGNSPFVVSYKIKDASFYDKPIDLVIDSNESFELIYNWGDGEKRNRYKYGEAITTDHFNFQIDKTELFNYPQVEGRYYFTINSEDAQIRYLQKNVQVRPENFNAKTIQISLTDYNKYKARDMVTAIDTLYLEYTKEAKNQTIKQKIAFLDNQIEDTESKLEEFEEYFESFIIENRTTDLQGDIRMAIRQLNAMDSSRFHMKMLTSDLELLETQLERDEPLLLNPILISRFPAIVSDHIQQYQNIQKERSAKLASYNENTFVIEQINRKMELIEKDLRTAVTEYRKNLKERMTRLEIRQNAVEREFFQLPSMSTKLSKNRRFYGLQEDFLLSLRKSKMELEITRAGTVTNFVILSSASLPGTPIKPQPMMIYGVGFSAGLVFSLIFILIRYLMHNKITSIKELERLVSVPVLGTIPEASVKLPLTKLIIKPSSKSAVSESLRTIRTNMEFLNASNGTRVLTVTSTISGEGKTFVAVNLGAIIAFSNQKVCIIDLDMRKPKVHLAFGDEPGHMGMSTLLIGKNKVKECLVKSSIENLDYIPAGPTPPNPSELILNKEYDEILTELKKTYDLIILDSPPVGLVTDAVLSMKKSDLQLYIIRSDYSKRTFVKALEDLKKINRFNNLTVIFNGVKSGSKGYGHAYGYGYGYGYGYYEESK